MTAVASPSEARPSFLDPFAVLGLTGILFLVVGGTEIATQLFPWGLGSPEWEFGTYSSVMDSFPLFTMGLGFVTVFAIARDKRGLAKVMGILFIVVALLIFAGAFLYATNVPQALRVGPRSPVQTGLKKAVTKATLQSAIYPIAYLWLGVFALRHSGRKR